MDWQKFVFLGFAIASCVATASLMGQPRRTMTPGMAAATCVIWALLTVLVLSI